MSRPEQNAFRRLGMFVGGFTLELAGAVVSDDANDEWAVIEQLSALVDRFASHSRPSDVGFTP